MSPDPEETRRTTRRAAGDGTRRGTRGLLAVAGLLSLALLVVAGLLLWGTGGDRASATSVYEESVSPGPEPTVQLTNDRGRVSVTGEEGLETVEIEATRYARGANAEDAREQADEASVEVATEGSTVSVETGGGEGVDYSLRVPAESSLEAGTEAGRVEASGLREATVRTEAGSVEVEDVGGPVSVEAPRGDVAVRSVSTDAGQVRVEVGSGDLELVDVVAGAIIAEVETGDVTLAGRMRGSGEVAVGTGNVTVESPSEDVGDLDLESRVGQVSYEGEG